MPTRALRIAYIAPEGLPIPPVSGGSVQIYLSQLFSQFKQHHATNIQPIVFCNSSARPSSLPFRLIRINRSNRAQYVNEVIHKLQHVSADLIQVDNRPAWVARIHKACPRTPIILNLHSVTFLSKGHISRQALAKVWNITSAVVVNSHALAAVLVKHYGAIKHRVHVIYPGVNLHAFPSRYTLTGSSKRKAFRTRNRCHGQFVFLYAGRVIRQKGVHTILQAFRQVHQIHRNTRLYIIGGTHPWESNYRKSILKMSAGLPVKVLPQMSHARLSEYYLGSDAFLCPSQGFEAFGLVNVEAMSTGLPVIASRQGGIAEIVRSTCGKLVVDFRSPKAFQLAMLEAIRKQTNWRGTLSREARRRVQNVFTWKQTAQGFMKLYNSLV